MTSNAQAPPEDRDVTGGFVDMMRHCDMDYCDDPPVKRNTQAEQDAEDEKVRKRAMRNLVNSWQERLQLISVITTFFASTEAAMLVNTKPANDNDLRNTILQVANASLIGALIVHVYASVLAFFGAFLLTSYKLKVATREELIVEGFVTSSPVVDPAIKDIERGRFNIGPQHTSNNADARTRRFASVPGQNNTNGSGPSRPHIYSAYPHIEQVGLFKSESSPHQLLDRTHAICVLLAGTGFILALVGILCYSWALQPVAVSIFASVCLGGALLAMLALRS
ncbi:hypothetical protein V8E55_009919 [Tylopilus felleus]